MEEVHSWIRAHLFDEVPMAICVLDRDHRIREANARFEAAFGSWRNRPCYEVYKDRTEPCLRCAAMETFDDGRLRSREEQGLSSNGERLDYLVHMFPVHRPDGGIPYVVEMSTDITLIKRLEREKRDAERLAAVGETVAGIAHGIKNIIMGLEGGMYAVNSGIRTNDDARIMAGWKTLESNVEQISEFMKEFLDFARGRETTAALTDPNLPARQVVDLYRDRAAEAGIRLEARLDEGLAPASLDASGIHACLANLVSNAIDSCAVADTECEFLVTVTSSETDGTLVYEVSDNGHGMDYEISRKVFSRFFSTKSTGRGTGLGLLMTKRIVHQHGGRISFDTAEGKGAVFRVELPRESLPEPTPSPSGRAECPARAADQ